MKQVLQTLKEHKLLLKMRKCEFDKKILDYIGHIIGDGWLRIDLEIMNVIVDFPKLGNIKKTMSFLGETQYLRNFIANFSIIAYPMHDITRKKYIFQWGREKVSFDTLKEKIVNAPMLAMPNLQQPFEIEIDVSEYGIRVVLMQGRKPTCYHSYMLNGAMLKYPIMIKSYFLLSKLSKNGNITLWEEIPSFILTTNHCSTCKTNPSCNK